MLLLAAAPFLAGCGDFWQAPVSTSASFSLSNSGNIAVTAGSTNTDTITVTPANSFTGTVALTCAITTAAAGATVDPTCSFSSASVDITTTTAGTSTLTVTAGTSASPASTGAYQLTVTGVSSNVAETTTFCVAVGVSTSSCTATATTSGDFYILNQTTISGYSVVSSALAQLSGSPYTLPSGTGSAIAIDPAESNLLYVATTGGIYLYNTQSMSATPTTISSVSGIVAIQVDPSGKWLLAANSSNILSAIPITSTGIVDTTRSEQTPVQLAGTPIQMAISPSDSNVIVAVALGTSGTQVFSFDWNSATPIGATPLKTVTPYNTSGGTAQSVAIDPQNRFLYIGETVALPNSTTGTGGLRVYTITSTGVNEITGSPYSSGGTGPHAILPESTGTYVYVANWAGNATGYGFKVTSSGALTPLSGSFTTGTDPVGLAEDNTDSFVLAVSSGGSPDLDAYSFDSSTGVLGTPLTVATTGTTPVAIVAVP